MLIAHIIRDKNDPILINLSEDEKDSLRVGQMITRIFSDEFGEYENFVSISDIKLLN